jgi:hypothetical protein
LSKAELARFSILAKDLSSLRTNGKIAWQTGGIIIPSYGAFLAEFTFRRVLDHESIGA